MLETSCNRAASKKDRKPLFYRVRQQNLHSFPFFSHYFSVYVFPGVGLGATVCGANRVTDRMLYIAAKALAECVPQEDLARGQVFPHISKIRQVSHSVAVAVVEVERV